MFQNRLSCRFAWQAWHFGGISTCFKTRPEWFCVAGAILDIFRRCVAFSVAGAALWTPLIPFCVAGAALQTCRGCMFFANRIVSAARSGDKVQIPWQAWHFVTCHAKSMDALRNIDFAEGPEENSDKCEICDASHFTLSTAHFTLCTFYFTLHTLSFTFFNWDPLCYRPKGSNAGNKCIKSTGP